MRNIPRALHLPPQGRSRWVSSQFAETSLEYLSWGMRRYHRHPVPMSRHTGWIYFCSMKGVAIFTFESRRLRLAAGNALIIHPDSACAIYGEKDRSCEILTWVWRAPPEFPSLRPNPGQWQKLHLPENALKRIAGIHAECRHEVGEADQFSMAALAALRTQLDLIFARRLLSKGRAGKESMRIELALQWMRRNLESRQPVNDLCQYLKISAPTLFRLFQRHLHHAPRHCFQELRIDRARQLLAAGHLVKEVAVLLGYAHPNDLSRALRVK